MSMQKMARMSWIGALAALAVVNSVQGQVPVKDSRRSSALPAPVEPKGAGGLRGWEPVG
jgi:hypothetical protein